MVPNFQIYKSRNLTPQRAAHWKKKEGQGFNLHLWWIIKGWIFGGLNIWCRLSRQDSIHHLRLGSSGFQNLAILLQTFARHHMMTDINELIFLGWFNYHYNSSNKKLLQSFQFFMEKNNWYSLHLLQHFLLPQTNFSLMFMFVILVEQSENTFLLFSQIQSGSKLIVCFRHGSNGYVPEKQFGIHQGFI